MNTPDDKRQIFTSPIYGRAEVERLAQALVDKFPDRLFGQDGRLVRLNEGRLAPITRHMMLEMVAENFASVRPTCSSDGVWQVTYYPLSVSGQEATDIMDTLLKRVATAQSEPKHIPERTQEEIRARFKTGEPVPALATAYGVDVPAIRSVVQAGQ